MKIKQIIILAVILLLLVIGVIIKQNQKPEELSTEEFSSIDISVAKESVASIYLAKPKSGEQGVDAVDLVLSENVWRIKSLEGARADHEKIQKFIDELSKVKGEIRGSDKSLFPDFGISDQEAFQVILKSAEDKEIVHLKVGTKKADSQSVFIRKNGSDLVYLTPANILGQAGIYGDLTTEKPFSEYWAAQDISVFEGAAVRKLEAKRFVSGKEITSINLTRESEGVWKFGRDYAPFKPDSAKILAFFDSFKKWKAQKILHAKKRDFGFASPVWTMTVTLENSQVIFTAGKMDPDTRLYPIQISTEPIVYELPQYYFTNFDQDDSRFFAENPFGVDPFRLLRVTVHTPEKEISINPKETNPDITGAYLQGLRSFEIKRLIWDSVERKKAKSPGREWLELQFDGGKSFVLDIGETVTGDSEKLFDYAAIVRGTQTPFVLSQESYEKIFKNLGPLTVPAQPFQPAQPEKK